MTAASGEPGYAPSGGSGSSAAGGPPVDVDVSGDVVRVVVHGDLDAHTSGPIVDTVVASFAALQGATQVVVDMSDAGFVDSTGLGSLVRLRIEARSHGARTSLVGLDPRLQKLLRLTGLDTDFTAP